MPILGHQGAGSITETTIRKLLTLQGAMQPAPDHLADGHGRRPRWCCPTTPTTSTSASSRCSAPNAKLGRAARRVLSNNQWDKLVARLADIQNPVVRTTPSKYSIKVERTTAAARAHGRLTHPAPAAPSSSQLFRFCQFDFTFPLGPADGRYLVRTARRGDE